MAIPDWLQQWFLSYFEGQVVLLPLFCLYIIGVSKKNISIGLLHKLHKALVIMSLLIPFILLGYSNLPVENVQIPIIIKNDVQNTSALVVTSEESVRGTLQQGRDIYFSDYGEISTFIMLAASLMGSVIFLLKLLNQQFYERRILSNANRTRLSKRLITITSSLVRTPFSSGIIEKRIFLPTAIDDTEKEVILSHEISHILSGDIEWVYFDNLLSHLFWYNPINHILSKQGQCLRELQCDLTVTKEVDPVHYANILYNTSVKILNNKKNLVLTAQWEEKRMLKSRIETILNGRPRTTNTMKFNSLVFFVLSILIFPVMLSSNPKNTTESGMVFDSPVPVGYITFEFGPQIHPLSGDWFLHKGIDIGYGLGTPIFAAAAGRVIDKGYEPDGFGYFIEIDHGNGYSTKYAQMHEPALFDLDEEVSRGVQIGKMGNSGISNGPHLHFEIRHEDGTVDPELYIDIKKRSTS